jgi:hypothetical protein
MRWGILGARITIIAVNLLIALVIVLSILPLASGGLKIDIPNQDVGKPTFTDNKVSFSVPVKIYNGGYFDITDFRMHFVVGQGGQQITDYLSEPTNIVTGKTTTVNVEFSLDLKQIPNSVLQRIVFEKTVLNLEVGVEAAYTLGLVKASVHTNQTMNWDPLISNFNVQTSQAQVSNNGTNFDISVPYSFDANDIIAGNQMILDATVHDSTSQIGSSSQAINIQNHNQGALKFTVPKDAITPGETLTFGLDPGFEGASFHYEYQWVVP